MATTQGALALCEGLPQFGGSAMSLSLTGPLQLMGHGSRKGSLLCSEEELPRTLSKDGVVDVDGERVAMRKNAPQETNRNTCEKFEVSDIRVDIRGEWSKGIED
ncbi:Hypothetical predicted protein, partial [Marmota monax]